MNDLAIPALHGIELFSGVGMLGEGLRAGLDYLGLPYRTICHVEREAHAASVLVSRMEEGSLDAAPIWPDVTTFDARSWRGKVDCVVAGFPCQDLSVAGRRAGLDDENTELAIQLEKCKAALQATLDDLILRAKLAEDDSLNISNSVLDQLEEALSSTDPAKIVAEHDAEVLEEAAKLCDSEYTAGDCALAISAKAQERRQQAALNVPAETFEQLGGY